ncbi:MAG: DEAD/DEAH box helicase [Balneolaceae bacterium]
MFDLLPFKKKAVHNLVSASYNSDLYPKFNVRYEAKGSQTFKGEMPQKAPGTFLDLFSPDINEKAVKASYLDTMDARKNWSAGNVSNFYTFAALLDAYIQRLNQQMQNLGMKTSVNKVTSGVIADYIANASTALTKKIKVRRGANGFSIALPLATFKMSQLLYWYFSGTQDVTDDKYVKVDDRAQEVIGADRDFILNFLRVLNGAEIVLPVDLAVKGAKKLQPKTINRLPISPVFSKSASFVNEYFNGYLVSLEKDSEAFNPNGAIKKWFDDFLENSVEIYGFVTLPFDEAEYYIQDKKENIKDVDILRFFINWYSRQKTKRKYPTYSYKYDKLKELSVGYPEKNRTNESGLMVTPDNKINWVPRQSYFNDAYFSDFEQAVTNDRGSLSLDFTEGKNVPKNQLIYVDWINEKLSYSDSNAVINIMNLDTTYNVIPKSYVDIFTSTTMGDIIETVNSISRAMLALHNAGTQVPILNSNNLLAAVEADLSFDQYALRAIMNKYKGNNPLTIFVVRYLNFALHYEQMHADSVDEMPEWIQRKFSLFNMIVYGPQKFREVFVKVIDAAEKAFADDTNIINAINTPSLGVRGLISDFGVLKVLTEIMKFPQILQAHNATTAKNMNINDSEIDFSKPLEVKNLENLEALMYHQHKTGTKLATNPEFAIIRASAGGGKTLTAIMDIVDMLSKGLVKRPLVLCPNNLIKDYVKEANYFSRGKLNVIPIDSSVFKQYCEVPADVENNIPLTYEYSALKNLIVNAPINTIVVIGYDVISQSTSNHYDQMYGVRSFDAYSHLDMLVECKFDGVWADESHYLKGNPTQSYDSVRLYINRKLISHIKYRRLLTGTLASNNALDFIKQLELFNPSILGTYESFKAKYSDPEFKGGFQPRLDEHMDALAEIRKVISENCMFINVERKEWAAFLPKMHEQFIVGTMTPNQQKVYSILIKKAVEDIEEQMKADGVSLPEDSEEDEEALDNLFEAYSGNLWAVEAFLANPMSIPISEKFLTTPADRISPKGKEVNKILRDHIIHGKILSGGEKLSGKTLIFCNTHASVEGIYKSLDDDIKKYVFVYSANQKAEAEQKFNTDPNIKAMIGVSQSMDTGLNLQVADSLIRVDTVWTPGRLEQGNARINRPKLKGEDPRMVTGIICYYISIDRTIDVVKFAKLTSKTVQLARFYNATGGSSLFHDTDSRYDDLGIDDDGKLIEPIRVTLDLLREGLSGEELERYLLPYSKLRKLEQDINGEYIEDMRQQGIDVTQRIGVNHTGIIEGSKILRNVPYVNGVTVPNMDELDLIPYLEYREQWLSEHEGKVFNPEGLLIHTEFGDGVCTREVIRKPRKRRKQTPQQETQVFDLTPEEVTYDTEINDEDLKVKVEQTEFSDTISTIRVQFDDGTYVDVHPTKAFVINRKKMGTMEIRDSLAKITGLDVEDIQLKRYRSEADEKRAARRQKRLAEQDARKRKTEERRAAKRQALEEKERRKRERVENIKPLSRTTVPDFLSDEDDEDVTNQLDMNIGLVNGIPTATIAIEDASDYLSTFRKYGFVITPDYLALRLKTKTDMFTFQNKLWDLHEAGKIELTTQVIDQWLDITDLAEKTDGRSKRLFATTPVTQTDITRYIRSTIRKVANPKICRVLPYITETNGKVEVYAVLDMKAHHAPVIQALRRLRVPSGQKWALHESVLRLYAKNRSQLKTAVAAMHRDGWEFEDTDSVVKGLKMLKMKGGETEQQKKRKSSKAPKSK